LSDYEDFLRAKEVAPYRDDAFVAEITNYVMGLGHRVLQVHKIGNDAGHIAALLSLFDPPEGAKILDAGAGIGEVARLMKCMRPDLDFTLLNVSQAQLDHCPDFACVCADFHDIPAPDEQFDAVMYLYSAGHGLLDRVLQEAARVVKPNGIIILYDLVAENSERLIETLGYKASAPQAIIETAARHGLFLTLQLFPAETNVDEVRAMMGDDFDYVFEGVRPAFHRFIKQVA
jgi:SAM-dependent methyltransferase